jgi:hypothetical protein
MVDNLPLYEKYIKESDGEKYLPLIGFDSSEDLLPVLN